MHELTKSGTVRYGSLVIHLYRCTKCGLETKTPVIHSRLRCDG